MRKTADPFSVPLVLFRVGWMDRYRGITGGGTISAGGAYVSEHGFGAVEPREVRIRPMTRKWGSCSTAGRLTLDEGLTKQAAEFRKEVIVHELLHLKVPNHSKLFKVLLRAYLKTG